MKLLSVLGLFFIAIRHDTVNGQNGPEQSASIILSDSQQMHTSKYVVPGNSSFQLQITVPVDNFSFYIIQIHSYLQSVNLVHINNTVDGTNIGLVVIPNGLSDTFIVENENPMSVQFMTAVVTYGKGAPVPGGCSSVLTPSLNLTEKTNLIYLSGKMASVDNSCTSNLTYHLYLRHSVERDFSLDSYFEYVSSMILIDDIRFYATEIPFGSPELGKVLASYMGTGVIAAIVVEGHNGSVAAYIPIHTFSCPDGDLSKCRLIESTYTKVGIVFLSVVGLLLCFFGCAWEIFELSAMAVLLGGSSVFLIIYDEDDPYTTKYVWMCAAAGVTVAVAALFSKVLTRMKFVHKHITCFTLGVFLSFSLFFAGIANWQILADDYWFWSVLIGLAMCFVIPLLCAPRFVGHVLASTLIGGFLVVLPLDMVGSSMKYLFFDIVRRIRVPDFNQAYLYTPFQTPDMVLVVAWLIVAYLGFMYQCKTSDARISAATARASHPTDTTPLLA